MKILKYQKNLELKSLDTLQTFSNEEFLADEVNHAPIAGLQYAVLNPDSLVDGQFTRETQLAFSGNGIILCIHMILMKEIPLLHILEGFL